MEKEMVINLFNYEQVLLMVASLTLNLIILSAIIIPKFILKQRKAFATSLYLFNFVIFVLCYVLSKTEIGFGAGIGLFALFAMLRFRSEMLNLQEMTYLLITISIGFVNAAFNGSVSFAEIVLLNLGLCAMVYIMDHSVSQPKLRCKKVKYGNLDLIKPDRNVDLIKDLMAKTGLEILKVRIDSIDLNEKIANVKVYYKDFEKKNGVTHNFVSPIKKLSSILKQNERLEKS